MDHPTHTTTGEPEVTTTARQLDIGGAPSREVTTTTTTHQTTTEVVSPEPAPGNPTSDRAA